MATEQASQDIFPPYAVTQTAGGVVTTRQARSGFAETSETCWRPMRSEEDVETPLHPAHAIAFVSEEIELPFVSQCIEVGLVERQAGAVQENLAAQIAEPGADRPVDGDGIGEGIRIFLAHLPP